MVGLEAEQYAGHSFRIGAATTADVNDALIKTLGRWKSDAYTLYVRVPRKTSPTSPPAWPRSEAQGQ